MIGPHINNTFGGYYVHRLSTVISLLHLSFFPIRLNLRMRCKTHTHAHRQVKLLKTILTGVVASIMASYGHTEVA